MLNIFKTVAFFLAVLTLILNIHMAITAYSVENLIIIVVMIIIIYNLYNDLVGE